MKKEFTLRTAQPGDGEAIFHVTRQSIAELSNGLYTPEQLNGWMGERTPEFYERLIKQGQLVVALQLGRIVGFVDSEPGEVTRFFFFARPPVRCLVRICSRQVLIMHVGLTSAL
ncbi:hypothetical protein [Pseudomonas versuta]|uniref:hypothetical protein n=1 Tax=Pseudomonas versuta TaxID=1788301 RepID=UPI000B0EBE29|nr:hypothetical protein [Pseudomonas versuta]